MNENKEQYVYVMSNPSFPADVLKIGWTKISPNIRAKNLHTTGIPTPFIVEYVIITPEGSKLEKKIHNHIKSYRVNNKREFFKISKDELSEKLINELMLELKSIKDINPSININYPKSFYEIKSLYEELKKETDEFFSKFEKEKSDLVVKKMNNKKYVYIIADEYCPSPLYIHGLDDDEESHIKNTIRFINRDIIKSKEILDKYNYKEIKNKIGIKTLISDNKSFKEMILNTHNNFRNIKNEYEWVF